MNPGVRTVARGATSPTATTAVSTSVISSMGGDARSGLGRYAVPSPASLRRRGFTASQARPMYTHRTISARVAAQ